MALPKDIKLKHNKLSTTPGVYLFKNKKGRVVYVGKATNLKSRVASYWKNVDATHSPFRPNRRMTTGGGRTIDEMLHEVCKIDYQVTDSVIEALILEANLIRKYMPAYNVKEKDDKSFLYVVITKETFPKVQLMRGQELNHNPSQPPLTLRGGDDRMTPLKIRGARGVMKVFGPYTSASSIRAALDLIRKWFPWAMCKPAPHPACGHPLPRGEGTLVQFPSPRGRGEGEGLSRPCFDYHIGRCPGVCVGAVTRREYMKNIRNVILMLEGKKGRVMKNLELQMKNAAREEKFEEAEQLRKKLFALRHIRDVAVITRDVVHGEEISRSPRGSLEMTSGGGMPINIRGRIEGYDISNISGTSAVGSMVVFENGEPKKNEYRKFKIKTVAGINDVAMMREVLERRFVHAEITKLRIRKIANNRNSKFSKLAISQFHDKIWQLPNLIVIDGGWGQVNVARKAIDDIRRQGLRSNRRPCLPNIPIVGIAKGFDRKQDQPIFDKNNLELVRIVTNHKDILLRVRDEAHRFAVAYHRRLREKRALST